MPEIRLTLNTDELAAQLATWPVEEVIELIKATDEHMGDWALIAEIKPWADKQHREMIQEETEDRAERAGMCTRSEEYPEIHAHVDPHRGCVLR